MRWSFFISTQREKLKVPKMKLIRHIIVTTVGWLLAGSGLLSAVTAAAELGKQITMSSIVAGAKKEAKVSWGTRPGIHEFQRLWIPASAGMTGKELNE
jgi:hypothetical protein